MLKPKISTKKCLKCGGDENELIFEGPGPHAYAHHETDGKGCLRRQRAKALTRIDDLELDCSGLMAKIKEQGDEIEDLRRWKGLPAEEFTRIKAERDEWEDAFRLYMRNGCPPDVPEWTELPPCGLRDVKDCGVCWRWWFEEKTAKEGFIPPKPLQSSNQCAKVET